MEERRENKPSAKSFLHLLKRVKWPVKITLIALFLSVVETIAGLVVPLITSRLVDSLTLESFDWKIIGFLLVVFVLQAITGGFSFYMLTYIGEKVVANMREQLWAKILTLPIPYYDQHETGETMSRITQDTSTLKTLITQHFVQVISGVISIIGAIVLLLIIDWKMTLILLISVPISTAIILPLGRMMHNIAIKTQKEMASFSGLLGRILTEIRLVKSYRAEERETETGNAAIGRLFQFGLKEAKVQAFISPIMTLIMMGLLVVILGYGGSQVASGALTAGQLVAIIFYLFQIIIPFTQIATSFTAFQKAAGATERIQEIFAMDSEQVNGKSVEAITTLTFDKVAFQYNESRQILKDLSFGVQAGTVTALVGPSGGGKTTIFSLLERFYIPTDGTILVDNNDLQQLSLEEWRRKVGYVSQESPLLSGTIFENITYGLTEAPALEQVRQAARAANALTFIEELPAGFSTEVGERGIKLSGGQRQRIAIARALLYDSQILLLDEATSNLDSASEILVQEALHHLMKGRTTFIIAHRLATIVHADRILFIEKGQITGQGTHEELLESHALYHEYSTGQGLVSE
ncbi:ABC transporter ATP-binding protein [Solibacillus sp. FSL H8-0538]|uniref:ABC transporter ATP-binding protein n=1 Tax=Solibacillus sp. FSL H8-0538 TaxID=2921400 RepID=UPI0030F769D9